MTRLFLLFLSSTLIACNSMNSLFVDDPIVDTQGLNRAQYEQDLVACQALAEGVDIAEDVAVGAATGAIVGGAVGATVGNSGTAKRGAGAGSILGGVRGAGSGIRDKERVVRRCLAGRGYRVLN